MSGVGWSYPRYPKQKEKSVSLFPRLTLWFFPLRLGGIIFNFFHKPTVDVGRSVRLSSFGSVTHVTIARNPFREISIEDDQR